VIANYLRMGGDMPSLTVRSIAEMLRLPAFEQVRILTEQKYPKQQPQSFRTPYYQAALTGIRNFYSADHAKTSLADARAKAQAAGQLTRRQNNLRVIDKFEESAQAARSLVPMANSRYSAEIERVVLRLSPDLQATEDDQRRVLYFNCRNAKLDDEAAKYTLEIAHWLLEQNEIEVKPQQIEYIDLATGKLHRVKKRRAATIRALRANAQIIDALWPTL